MGKTLEELVLDEDLFRAWITYIIIFSIALVLESYLYGRVQINLFEEIMEKFKSSLPSTSTPLMLFTLIFFHNFGVAILTATLSATFIVPAAVMILNGLIVGYVISYSFGRLGVAGSIAGLIPHGGVEVPAIALAAAVGVAIKKGLRNYIRSVSVTIVVIILMLIIAALTESIVTPSLIAFTLKLLGRTI